MERLSSLGTLTRTQLRSPLMEAMSLGARQPARKKKIVATLILTSLVDAFSIMLLYLLVQNTGNGSTLELDGAARLPTAVEATALHEGTRVRVVGNRYLLGDEPIAEEGLAARLQVEAARETAKGTKEPALIVQADRSANFARLAQVIRAGSISGYHVFKFAVLQDGGQP